MQHILKAIFLTLILISSTALQAQISSNVISWNRLTESTFWGEGSDYETTFCQTYPSTATPEFTIDNCDYSALAFSFDTDNLSLSITNFFLDQLADFYVLKDGDKFSRSSTVLGEFSRIRYTSSAGLLTPPVLMPSYENELDYLPISVEEIRQNSLLTEGQIAEFYFDSGGTRADIFLGISTSEDFADSVYERDSYGWMQFHMLPNPDYDPEGNQFGLTTDRYILEMVDHALAFDSDGIIVGTRTSLPVPEPSTAMMLGCISFAWLSRYARIKSN